MSQGNHPTEPKATKRNRLVIPISDLANMQCGFVRIHHSGSHSSRTG